ncbi:MAG: alanine--tRNA ligase, partial [Proteobacteria bacterium]|nr:alanine--tRNA ligase [Pseudomonadota bacterium]
QFKDTFLGEDPRSYNRATTVQKCLRVSGKHNDLEQVGRTPRHHTFFEMLGNFSFGNYFKKEACRFAWDLLLNGFKLDSSKLWITIFEHDDEAEQIWLDIGVPSNRIQRMGEKDNFWSMGDVGPCGPCTEIHYDHGPKYGDDPNGPAGETDRYVEIWNLVFMQYDRNEAGELIPLPNPSIDTGLGLERIAAIKQGVYSNYETDQFQAIIQDVAELANIKYGDNSEQDIALQVIADHARASTFLIGDGVMPSNEGRGYVLRRIMRRAIRYGVRLNIKENFLYKAAAAVVREMGDAYPEIVERAHFIDEVIRGEEMRFSETLEKGLSLLEEAFKSKDFNGQLNGDLVFLLHDTYGFPMDLTELIANERGHSIDEDGYTQRMAEQKAAGRANWKGSGELKLNQSFADLAQRFSTDFTGYNSLSGTAQVVALLNNKNESCDVLLEDQKGIALLDKTPFYAEGGGQVGDCGLMFGDGLKAEITDTQKPLKESFLHSVLVTEGTLTVGQTVTVEVNKNQRLDTRRNHTATHILHAALRNRLGTHVTQKGSLVNSDKLRFDFSHHKAMTLEELELIANDVQAEIFKNTTLGSCICSMNDAKEKGAMALFGEKYGDEVRVVEIPGYSVELCGGTHAQATGEIGLFHILSESGIAAGVRRIEALTGRKAVEHLQRRDQLLTQSAQELKSLPEDIHHAIGRLVKDKKRLEKELEHVKTELARAAAGDLLQEAQEFNGIKVLSAEFSGDPKALREEADRLRNKLGSGVVVLGSRTNGVKLVAAVTKDLAGSKVHAGNLIREVAKRVGGGGGGRPDLAQAGGKNPEQLPEALSYVYSYIENETSTK